MKRKLFSDEKIIGVLNEHEAGVKVDDICRHQGISPATFCTWRKKYGGMEASDARRLKALEVKNVNLTGAAALLTSLPSADWLLADRG